MSVKTLIYGITILGFLALIATTFPSGKQNGEDGIQFFEGSLSEALAKAEEENKLVFMDVYATWCGPCKALKQRTFPVKEVGDVFNTHFINVAMDGEKGEGPEIVKKYGVRAYPTLLFLNPSGEVVHQFKGFRPAAEFLAIANHVIENNK